MVSDICFLSKKWGGTLCFNVKSIQENENFRFERMWAVGLLYKEGWSMHQLKKKMIQTVIVRIVVWVVPWLHLRHESCREYQQKWRDQRNENKNIRVANLRSPFFNIENPSTDWFIGKERKQNVLNLLDKNSNNLSSLD